MKVGQCRVSEISQLTCLDLGVVIYDGRFLRDLSYAHDSVGHLPAWLDALSLPPSYFHNLLSSTAGQPVIYIDITPFINSLSTQQMQLCKERAEIDSPSGEKYRVNRYVYSATVQIRRGTALGSSSSTEGSIRESLFVPTFRSV